MLAGCWFKARGSALSGWGAVVGAAAAVVDVDVIVVDFFPKVHKLFFLSVLCPSHPAVVVVVCSCLLFLLFCLSVLCFFVLIVIVEMMPVT